jgi:hypothetical protein
MTSLNSKVDYFHVVLKETNATKCLISLFEQTSDSVAKKHHLIQEVYQKLPRGDWKITEEAGTRSEMVSLPLIHLLVTLRRVSESSSAGLTETGTVDGHREMLLVCASPMSVGTRLRGQLPMKMGGDAPGIGLGMLQRQGCLVEGVQTVTKVLSAST